MILKLFIGKEIHIVMLVMTNGLSKQPCGENNCNYCNKLETKEMKIIG